jgi:hypothetical protein
MNAPTVLIWSIGCYALLALAIIGWAALRSHLRSRSQAEVLVITLPTIIGLAWLRTGSVLFMREGIPG